MGRARAEVNGATAGGSPLSFASRHGLNVAPRQGWGQTHGTRDMSGGPKGGVVLAHLALQGGGVAGLGRRSALEIDRSPEAP
jgi:hypothetical protein